MQYVLEGVNVWAYEVWALLALDIRKRTTGIYRLYTGDWDCNIQYYDQAPLAQSLLLCFVPPLRSTYLYHSQPCLSARCLYYIPSPATTLQNYR